MRDEKEERKRKILYKTILTNKILNNIKDKNIKKISSKMRIWNKILNNMK